MKLVNPAVNFEFVFRIWNFICERTRWKPDRYSIFAAATTNFLRANRSIIIINMRNTIDPITAQPRENYTPLQTRNSPADIIRADRNVDGTAWTIDRRATFSQRLGAHREVDDAARDPQITARRIRQLPDRSRVQRWHANVRSDWFWAKTRIRGQFVKPSTFHLSQHGNAQREDTDLPTPFRTRARSGFLHHPIADVDTAPAPPAMCAYRAIFERARMDNAFTSAGRGRRSLLGRDFARGNAREKVGRISKTEHGGLSLSADRQCAREANKRKERLRAPVSRRSAFSITIDSRAFLRPLSSRRCEIERLI